jgi:hypothetical protein
MAAIEACRPPFAIACVLLAVAAAAARPTFAQPTIERAADDAKSDITERIRQVQSEGGPYSKELIDPLTTLSLQYLEDGQSVLADAVLEQALQVMRANYGLRSLEQAPLLRQRIRSEEKRGDFAAAWELERTLTTMARAHPDDLRAAEVFREIGDKRMDVLERYRDGEFPPQLALGCYYYDRQPFASPEQGNQSCTSGNRQFAQQAILNDAQRNYTRAIDVLLRQRRYSDEQLHELERNLIESSYVYGGPYRAARQTTGSLLTGSYIDGHHYMTGRQSLRRLLAYDAANRAPLLRRATALVHVADWDLVFEHRPLALATYEQTYEQLKQQGVPQAAIDELFSPATPVVLPTFVRNPLLGDDAPATGYIDVAFEIMNVGFSRRIEILGSSENASEDAKDELVRLIQRSRFRPRVTDGQFARAVRVVVRYPLRE